MKALKFCLLFCALAVSTAAYETSARDASKPVAQVKVSKPATSLPGSRYAWVEMPPQMAVEFDKRVQDPQLRRRLQAALDKALQAKGYRRSDSIRQADIALAYRVGVRDAQQATVRDSAGQQSPEMAIECGAGGCSQIVTRGNNGVPTVALTTEDMIEGGLLVEVLKPGDVRVLWRALYRGSVRAKNRQPVDLDNVAKMTLAQLPKAGAGQPQK